MKYFTRSFISGAHPDRDGAIAGYRSHLAALKLPAPVAALAKLYVHDALVKSVASDGDTVSIGLCCGDSPRGYIDVRVTFNGARLTEAARRLLKAPRIEILSSEIHRKGAAFEYRLLLWPKGQVAIRFRSVEIARKKARSRSIS
jgi:hypothetical protein